VAQLSFPPRRTHNENIARAPRLLPHVISVSEHTNVNGGLIPLDDLGVTADATQLYLVQMSTGAQIQPHVLHALEASVQTPPLARFLAEVASARCGVYGPFDFGAARALRFLPRVRHGRAVLSPARWLLDAADLPAPEGATPAWEKTLSAWRGRWGIPSAVVLCEGELRLPLDLDDQLHRVLLRTRLDRTRRVELREADDHSNLAWAGRACELLVPLTLTRPRPAGGRGCTALQATVSRGDALLPGHSALLHAQLFGHPMRFNEILTDHLPRLLNDVTDHTLPWWFRRHHDTTRPDTDHHLGLYLRLRGPQDYGAAAKLLADWAAELSALGLVAHLSLGTYQPQNGRYGYGTAAVMEDVFAADSTAALAEITMATRTDIPMQAIAAASMADLAACFATDPEVGCRWLIDLLPREQGRLEQSLRDAALLVADTAGNGGVLSAHPGAEAVAAAWDRRQVTLATYRQQLAEERDPATVLRSLLHDHHVRAVGVDPDSERVVNRLARAAALRQIALSRRRTP
jgi:thiopeptide-type bacteriocin biosynthesis protein